MEREQQIMAPDDMQRSLGRIALEVMERNRSLADVVLVGILRRGVPLADRLAADLGQLEGAVVPVASLDINLYRDDLQERAQPLVRPTQIPFSIAGKKIVLVDDVLFTGRTIRAALDALMDLGRPSEVQLAVLVDRGHQELPIRADYVGRAFATEWDDVVKVRLMEVDEVDEVVVSKRILGLPIFVESDESEAAHGNDC